MQLQVADCPQASTLTGKNGLLHFIATKHSKEHSMIRGRFARRMTVLTVIIMCFLYIAVYLTTQHEFDVDISLEKPRKGVAPLPWEQTDWNPNSGRNFPQRVIQVHHGVGHNATERLETVAKAPDKDNGDIQRVDNESELADRFMKHQAEINRMRREIMKRSCAKYPELARGAISGNTYRHIYVNDRHKLLYCFVPKVGCSNWKRLLMILSGNTKSVKEISSDEVHFHNGMKRLAGYSRLEQQQRLKNYTTFMYVRNPFVRVLSAFNNKYGDVVQYRKETYFQGFAKTIMKKFRPGATPRELRTGENITWTEFVKFLTQPQRPFFDDHWEEVYKICSPCKINYDYVGHLETVNDDATFMLQELALDSLVAFPSRENSHPTNSTADFEKAFRELPRADLQRLWKIFEKDFELFNYTKPNFV